MIITGKAFGIGVEATAALSALSATRPALFLTARYIKKAEAVLVRILELRHVSLIEIDNTSCISI
jgi:hypothetical protein